MSCSTIPRGDTPQPIAPPSPRPCARGAATPLLIVAATVSGTAFSWWSNGTTRTVALGGGFLFAGPLLMILFRRKYPRWWFDWNLELLRFSNRITIYLALMNDRYPSTDEA